MAEKKRCFVITPIGGDTDPIRRHIEGIIDAAIEPALGGKYEIVVAHRISTPGTITKQIIKEIYQDELVIANLTDRNPNVMYELAFRHSLGKPVIMIAEKSTALPSDIIMERVIFYHNDARGALELREALVDAENEVDFEKETSPIYDVISEADADAKIVDMTKSMHEATNNDVLQYILKKLNNLEDALVSVNSRQNSIAETKERNQYRIMLRVGYAEGPVDINHVMDNLISDIQSMDGVESVSTYREIRHMAIDVLYSKKPRVSAHEVGKMIVNQLRSYGFKEPKVVDAQGIPF